MNLSHAYFIYLSFHSPLLGYSYQPTMSIGGTGRPNHAPSSRRDVVRGTVSAFFGVATIGSAMVGDGALALEKCRPNALNCIRTVWYPPEGTSRAEAVRTLRDVLGSYPQSGQSGVDCSGWAVAVDDLDGSTSSARVEFRSCVGPAALAINLARPFVDDLKLEVGEDGSIEVRSSSRMGASDVGVNKKRVDFLGKALRAKGWKAPAVNYGSQ